MPTFTARPATIEAHLTDDGTEYLVRIDGTFVGVLDAPLFDRVFRPAAARLPVPPPDMERSGVDRRELPGTPHDQIPAVDLAGAIAARTTPGGPRVHVPRTPEEVGAVLDQTRKDVEQIVGGDEMSQAIAKRKIRHVAEGEKPGKGYKVCPKCRAANGASASKCIDCGKKF